MIFIKFLTSLKPWYMYNLWIKHFPRIEYTCTYVPIVEHIWSASEAIAAYRYFPSIEPVCELGVVVAAGWFRVVVTSASDPAPIHLFEDISVLDLWVWIKTQLINNKLYWKWLTQLLHTTWRHRKSILHWVFINFRTW